MAKTHNLAVPIANFEVNGETQTKWQTIGAIFTNDSGKMSIRLNCIPTHHINPDGVEEAWNGWVKVFEEDRPSNFEPRTYPELGDDNFTDPRDDVPF